MEKLAIIEEEIGQDLGFHQMVIQGSHIGAALMMGSLKNVSLSTNMTQHMAWACTHNSCTPNQLATT